MNQRKLSSWIMIPSLVLACALVGGMFGPRMGAAEAADADTESAIDQGVRDFSAVLATIESRIADPVDAERAIYNGAIPEMLHKLDPHSSFWDPEAFERMREDQRGHYAGVGMTISERNGETFVLHPFPRTPAYNAGLRPGDVIVEVDGKPMKGLSTNDVAGNLRGPEGADVKIGYRRPGKDGLTEVTVTRASIPRPSVPVAFNVRPKVGFVKVDSFNETTGQEVEDAVKNLGGDRLEGLILDLRNNRGGLLSQGVRVSDVFLDKGDVIVSHRGRNSNERTYKAQKGNEGLRFPVVVLVNCNSASASEIVAGAIQDHDRGLVMGMSTFGKGLVQTVYPLAETAGLALTTARYYTPSGRLIQRRYEGVSMSEYYSDPCSEHYKPNHDEVRLTDGGRQVYGGGGITPDILLDPERLNDFQILLMRRYVIENFAQSYTLDRQGLPEGWDVTDEVIEEFHQFLLKEEVEFTEADFLANKDYIRRHVKRNIFISTYDIDEGEKVYYELDPEVEKAIEALPKAKALLESPSSLVADGR